MFKVANATPAGAQIKTPTAKLTIIDNEGPGTLNFSSSSYTVLEGAGVASITVNRIGATNLKLSVDYATQAASANPASAVTDYTAISPARTLTSMSARFRRPSRSRSPTTGTPRVPRTWVSCSPTPRT